MVATVKVELTEERPQRRIRSFVRRPGRLTVAQEKALEVLLPKYEWDTSAPWPKDQRVVMEIGFGNGQALLEMAPIEPTTQFMGVEVHPPGVGRLLIGLERGQISNVKVAMVDAVELLTESVPMNGLDEVRLFFPDPWPKKKHHKRRLLQPEFVALLAQRIRPGGRLHVATDWMPYAEWIEEIMALSPDFEYQPTAIHQRTQTHFERRGQRRGHEIRDLIYQRVSGAPT